MLHNRFANSLERDIPVALLKPSHLSLSSSGQPGTASKGASSSAMSSRHSLLLRLTTGGRIQF